MAVLSVVILSVNRDLNMNLLRLNFQVKFNLNLSLKKLFHQRYQKMPFFLEKKIFSSFYFCDVDSFLIKLDFTSWEGINKTY
jgi:hypothetical protein